MSAFPYPCYIVSLKKDKERRLSLIPQLNRLGMSRVWSAGILVTPEECDPNEYCDLEAYHTESVSRDPRYIKAVVGARRAQIRALKKAAAAHHTEDWVLMLEDDIVLPEEDEMQDVLDRLRYVPDECPIVLLYRHVASEGRVDEHGIVTVNYWSRGFCAYLIRPDFISELARTIENLCSEADMCWEDLVARGYPVLLINCVLSNQKKSNIIGEIEQLERFRK